MTRQELTTQIRSKKSYLCVGLDTDIDNIPKHLLKGKDPIFEFNKGIIDAVSNGAVISKGRKGRHPIHASRPVAEIGLFFLRELSL